MTLLAYNTELHSTTGNTPFYLVFQQRANLLMGNPLSLIPQLFKDDDWESLTDDRVRKAWKVAHEMIKEHQLQQAKSYNKSQKTKASMVLNY